MLSATMSLSGVPGFIAGAATTANLVTDPRTTQQIWNDNQIEFEVAGLGNKPLTEAQLALSLVHIKEPSFFSGPSEKRRTARPIYYPSPKVKGVKELHNQVKIAEPLSVSAISNDSWITTK